MRSITSLMQQRDLLQAQIETSIKSGERISRETKDTMKAICAAIALLEMGFEEHMTSNRVKDLERILRSKFDQYGYWRKHVYNQVSYGKNPPRHFAKENKLIELEDELRTMKMLLHDDSEDVVLSKRRYTVIALTKSLA